jgi:hypothetical protein
MRAKWRHNSRANRIKPHLYLSHVRTSLAYTNATTSALGSLERAQDADLHHRRQPVVMGGDRVAHPRSLNRHAF